jgi:hypothetical protein
MQPRPAQPSDSIARQAVDPSRVGNNAVLWLLDEVQAHVELDGTGRRTHRTVMQVISQAGVNGAAERRFNWQPGRQELTLDWARVLRIDGSVVSEAPSTDQTGDVTASMQNPIYTDNRTRRISLSGVAPGTIVDVQYTLTDRALACRRFSDRMAVHANGAAAHLGASGQCPPRIHSAHHRTQPRVSAHRT